mgnify:FL=1
MGGASPQKEAQMLYEKFGEFDSAEEINAAADGQKAEGDTDAIFVIAQENGLDREDAQDFIDGVTPELCSLLSAALGKLKVESAALKPAEIMEDWLSYIMIRCGESVDMAAAVRKKGKSLKGCIAALLKWSFGNQHPVDGEILKAAGVTASRCTLGIPGMETARRIITEYYLGK